MARLDRYLLSQLMALFGFFALVLVGVYWINRAVMLFDQLVGDGQSALVFLEISVLTLPNVIRLVLPVAGFVAAVYVTNRLTLDSELVVMQAAGVSPFRMARPVVWFGLIVTAMLLILAHVLVPASRMMVTERRAELSENVTARFLNEGQFTHPAKGVTLYIRDISAEGGLRDLFLSDDRDARRRTTYTAAQALFVRGPSGPKIIMFNGMAQILDSAGQRLSVTRFADFTYDIGALLSGPGQTTRTSDAIPTRELMFPTPALMDETGETLAALRYDLHSRFAGPLLALPAALIGFAALLQGSFSRFGLWKQVVMAICLLVLLQAITTVSTQLGIRSDTGWVLAYLAPLTGLTMAAGLLWQAGRPRHVPQGAPAALPVAA